MLFHQILFYILTTILALAAAAPVANANGGGSGGSHESCTSQGGYVDCCNSPSLFGCNSFVPSESTPYSVSGSTLTRATSSPFNRGMQRGRHDCLLSCKLAFLTE